MAHPWPTFSPEANYTALMSGAGPASTLAYAETLGAHAANLQTVVAASAATGTATYGANWQGASAAASATTQTALDTQHELLIAALLEKAPHVAAAAAAHQTALASMVTAEQALANRIGEHAAEQINLITLGALTPRIAALNLQYYGHMWPRNAAAGAAYGVALRASTAAIMLPFPPAVAGASPVAPAVAAAALAENAAMSAAGATMQASEQALQAAITPAAAATQTGAAAMREAAPLAATQTPARTVTGASQAPTGMFTRLPQAGAVAAPTAATPGGQGLASSQVDQALISRAETLTPPTGSAPGPGGVASGYPGAGFTSYVRPTGDGFTPPPAEQASSARPGMLNAAELRGPVTTAPLTTTGSTAAQPLAYVHPEPPRPTVSSTPSPPRQLDLGDTAHTLNLPPPPPRSPTSPPPASPPALPPSGVTDVPATPLNEMRDPTGTGEGGEGGIEQFEGGPPGGAFSGGGGGFGGGGNPGRGGGGSTTGGGTPGGGLKGGGPEPPRAGTEPPKGEPAEPPSPAPEPSPPQGINGFTDHGREQINNRDGHGVNDRALQDAVDHPTMAPLYETDEAGRGAWLYYGKDATVILNKDGQVVTAWARGRDGWRH
ncbi:PPE domain-containing protein [Mycobacterium sp. 852002-51057_SCH5723018]|uniref:PPE domain-containing protein n=1 Tax=Mycobacterium sp. 852002-51057_SCH5723018 TaxID=1834094 RepID=UPI0009EEFD80|nr:PPE domain-containing protein [Mycobacterium sp. 852002-51057_SCH5723018]